MTKNIKSVSVIGDSIFKGVIYDENRRRYIVSKDSCGRLLENEVPFKINNYSRFGITIKDAYKVLNYVLDHSSDEIIVIEIGGNDSNFDWNAIANYPEGEYLPNTSLMEYGKYLEKIIKRIMLADRVPVLATLPPVDANKYFDWIKSKGLNGDNILKWLGTVDKIYTFHDHYNEVIENLSRKYNLGLIDLRNGFIYEKENNDELISIDGIHPSLTGQRLIKDIILKAIKHSSRFTI